MLDNEFITEAIKKYGEKLFEDSEDSLISPLVEFAEVASSSELLEEETNILLDYVFGGVSESIINEVSDEYIKRAASRALGRRKDASDYSRYAQNLTKSSVVKKELEAPKMTAQSRLNKAKDIASGNVSIAKNYDQGSYKRATSNNTGNGSSALSKLKSVTNSVKNFFKRKDDSPVGLSKALGSDVNRSTSDSSNKVTTGTATGNSNISNSNTATSGAGTIQIKNNGNNKKNTETGTNDVNSGTININKKKEESTPSNKESNKTDVEKKEPKVVQPSLFDTKKDTEASNNDTAETKSTPKSKNKKVEKTRETSKSKEIPKQKRVTKKSLIDKYKEAGYSSKEATAKGTEEYRKLKGTNEAVCELATLLVDTNISESCFVEIMELLMKPKAIKAVSNKTKKEAGHVMNAINDIVRSQAGLTGKKVKTNSTLGELVKKGDKLARKETWLQKRYNKASNVENN